jgi:hypothetical protein
MSEPDPNQPDPTGYEPKGRPSRFGGWLHGWVRDTFSREQLISSFKSFLWVAPLTILIWVYAEREQPEKVDNQVIIFSMQASDPRILVTVLEPEERSLMAELRGSRVQVDAVKELLAPKSDQQPPVRINISTDKFPPGGGPYIESASVIAEDDIFRNNYVTVAKVSPAQLKFNVDRIVTVDVDVQAPPPDKTPNLSGIPVFEPRRVQVTGPERLVEKDKVTVTADFSKFAEMSSAKTHEVNVPLTLSIANRNITVAPANVKATFTVQELKSEVRLNSIPLNVMYTPGLETKYWADCEKVIRNVTFFGPRDIIDKIKAGTVQPKVRIEVSSDDVTNPVGQPRKAKVKFDLPPGVTVSRDDEEKEITFKLLPQTPVE